MVREGHRWEGEFQTEQENLRRQRDKGGTVGGEEEPLVGVKAMV